MLDLQKNTKYESENSNNPDQNVRNEYQLQFSASSTRAQSVAHGVGLILGPGPSSDRGGVGRAGGDHTAMQVAIHNILIDRLFTISYHQFGR